MNVTIFSGTPLRVEKEMKEFLKDEEIVVTHMSQCHSPSSFSPGDITLTLVYTLHESK